MESKLIRMVSISKVKIILLLILPISLGIVLAFSITYMENGFSDPEGQLNNPVTLQCDAGVLANRTITVTDDGEYNWIFIKNQELSILITPIEENVSMQVFFSSYQKTISHAWLNQTSQKVVWAFQIPASGHYRLELANWEIRPHPVQIYVNALPVNHSFGLFDCLNPGDLFRVG